MELEGTLKSTNWMINLHGQGGRVDDKEEANLFSVLPLPTVR